MKKLNKRQKITRAIVYTSLFITIEIFYSMFFMEVCLRIFNQKGGVNMKERKTLIVCKLKDLKQQLLEHYTKEKELAMTFPNDT